MENTEAATEEQQGMPLIKAVTLGCRFLSVWVGFAALTAIKADESREQYAAMDATSNAGIEVINPGKIFDYVFGEKTDVIYVTKAVRSTITDGDVPFICGRTEAGIEAYFFNSKEVEFVKGEGYKTLLYKVDNETSARDHVLRICEEHLKS